MHDLKFSSLFFRVQKKTH